MPVYGDLRTVSLTDLLLWASRGEKTGVLEVERDAISKRVEFRKGWVGSCSSNDPSLLLGQFLLSRGRIDEIQLQHLLTLQRFSGRRLEQLLTEMKLLSRQEVAREVAVKAEETVYSLFDHRDAFFRFDEGATLDPDQIEVHLHVDELLDKGRRRAEQLERIRAAFESSSVVLRRTDREAPEGIADRPPARRILDAVDGRRSIAEILLFARSSEFLVLQFLHRLHERGVLERADTGRLCPPGRTLLDRSERVERSDADANSIIEELAAVEGDPAPDRERTPGAERDRSDVEIEAAVRLMERQEHEAAVKLLRATCRQHPGPYARRLLLKAEEACVARLKEDGPLPTRVPVLLADRRTLTERGLSPEEAFLLGLVDGSIDVQSILWLAPLREVDTLMALRELERKQAIRLADPAAIGVHASAR